MALSSGLYQSISVSASELGRHEPLESQAVNRGGDGGFVDDLRGRKQALGAVGDGHAQPGTHALARDPAESGCRTCSWRDGP